MCLKYKSEKAPTALQTTPAHLDILRVCEVAGVEDGFVVRVAAAEEDAAAGLGAQQHGDD